MQTDDMTSLEFPGVTIRNLEMADLDHLIEIDRRHVGRRRPEYLRKRVEAALRDAAVRISFVAEHEGELAGFLLGAVTYGEYGVVEPVATIDTLGVDPVHEGKGVGRALLEQLFAHLKALDIERIQTQVDWNDFGLLGFLAHAGFQPAPVFCLERALE